MIPLYGSLEGDTLVLLIFAYAEDTIERLGQKLQEAADSRVEARKEFRVLFKNRELNLQSTVGDIGLTPLDLFSVVEGSSHGV